jgi:hypothetical protein
MAFMGSKWDLYMAFYGILMGSKWECLCHLDISLGWLPSGYDCYRKSPWDLFMAMV